jgi:16S rRNA U1498 N3-methylase RsmE
MGCNTKANPRSRSVIFVIACEWAGEELAWFRETGWVAASLGNTILRAETAAIVATAIALEALH